MKLSKISYSFYGKCYELSANNIKLIVTAEVGPRIVYYGDEKTNVFFNDKDNLVNKGGEYFDKNFKKGESWKIYGGHRLWKSPEDLASYTPDNYPYEIMEIERGLKLVSPVEKMTGIIKTITLTMNESGDAKVEHSFKNTNNKDISVSLWALSVLAAGGKAFIPISDEDTGFLANRNFVYWPYSNDFDVRVKKTSKYVAIGQDINIKNPYKIGTYNKYGVLGFYLKNSLFVKRFETFDDLVYPDFNSNSEVYTNDAIIELETLSPIYKIAPNQTKTHTELWSFKNIVLKTDDDIYTEIMKK